MDWEVIRQRLNELLQEGQHGQLRGALMMLNPVDIADYMGELDHDKLLVVFRVLPKDIAAEVFSYMDTDRRHALMVAIGDAATAELLNEMYLDDAVDFLEELPANAVRRILQNTDPKTRATINRFLNYPVNSAGSLMTIEYCDFDQTMTVREAMDEIRRTGIDKETIYTLYITDRERRLIGAIPLHKVIAAPDDQLLRHLVEPGVVSAVTTDDQEQVADTVRRYHLLSIPVVDHENRLVGIVTADDIMDVIEAENTEDFEKMSGLAPAEEPYFKTPLMQMVKNRLPWLLILMFTSIVSGAIMTRFEHVLAVSVLLQASIPMLMDTGGNCGQQASTLMIRGLALGEVNYRDILKVLFKEIRVGLIVGVVLSAVTFGRLLLLNQASVVMASVISVSLLCTVVIAKSVGCLLPMLADRINIDPALAASPLITTVVDALSLTIYFSIASVLIL
ncbi:MAG: magnesium transporter [Clostridiales bacterium]|nr:magnesium transporter [Clostridiales bacterium]